MHHSGKMKKQKNDKIIIFHFKDINPCRYRVSAREIAYGGQ